MATAYLSRLVRFRAWHRLFVSGWSEARNVETFGNAARQPPHGHDYQCTVTVRGTADGTTGTVIDLALLDRILREEITGRFDGRELEAALPTTGESLCLDIWRRVEPRLPAGCRLAVVRVAEDPTLYAEYRGED